MIPYLLLFATVAAAALGQAWAGGGEGGRGYGHGRVPGLPPTWKTMVWQTAAWWSMGVLLVLMIGLRDGVGGDWGRYLHKFDVIGHAPLAMALDPQADPYSKAPGYFVLNWLVARLGGSIYLVNVVCAAVFVGGLLPFCRQQPRPWLALAVAIPYLVIVVGMGYTRQAVAIGLIMSGLVALTDRRLWRFCGCVLLALLFHRGAMVAALLLVPVLAGTPRHWRLGLAFAGALLACCALLMSRAVPIYMAEYLNRGATSAGADVRVAMDLGAALILLACPGRLGVAPGSLALWRAVAWSMVALALVMLVVPSSTAVDRLALFWLPLQVFTMARLPLLADAPGTRRELAATGAVVSLYALVLGVWLDFSVKAHYWLPYRFHPFVAWTP